MACNIVSTDRFLPHQCLAELYRTVNKYIILLGHLVMSDRGEFKRGRMNQSSWKYHTSGALNAQNTGFAKKNCVALLFKMAPS